MFNLGGGEILVIMVIALIVLGPTRLPDAARQVGKAMSELRQLSSSFQQEVRSAIELTDEPDQSTDRRRPLTTTSEPVAEDDATGGPTEPEAPPHPTEA